jgi:sialate O-acetylesterase
MTINKNLSIKLQAGQSATGLLLAIPLLVGMTGCQELPQTPSQLSSQSPEGTQPFPGGKKAELWIAAGQSNMSGCGRYKFKLHPSPEVMMFNMDNTWMVAEEPLHRIFDSDHPVIQHYAEKVHQVTSKHFLENRAKSKLDATSVQLVGTGMGIPFAHALHKGLGRPVGLIPCAYGGTLMSDWDPALKDKTNESLYGYMLQRARMVGGPISGIIWDQGEGDASYVDKAPAYEQNMLTLIDSVRRDLGQPDLPFILVQTGRYCVSGKNVPGPTWDMVRDAQRRLMNERKGVYAICPLDLPLDDVIHISQEGHIELGRRLAETALTEVYHKKGHGTAIQLDSMETISSDHVPAPPCFSPPYQIRVSFRGVTGKLNASPRPAGFELLQAPAGKQTPFLFRAEIDPTNPAAVLLSFNMSGNQYEPGMKLVYGSGMDAFVNIVDDKGMPIPAFGPIDIPMPDEKVVVQP